MLHNLCSFASNEEPNAHPPRASFPSNYVLLCHLFTVRGWRQTYSFLPQRRVKNVVAFLQGCLRSASVVTKRTDSRVRSYVQRLVMEKKRIL